MAFSKMVSQWDLMALLNNEAIYAGLAGASKLTAKWELERAGKQPFVAHQHRFYVDLFQAMANALTEAELPLAAKHAEQIVLALKDTHENEDGSRVAQGASLSLLEHHLGRLVGVLPDEAGIRLFVMVPPDLSKLYEPKKPPFGDKVEAVFPIAIDDIREAGRCIAVGQGTAAVFHLMRVMEAGLRGVANELGIPYAPSWESYISQLSPLLEGKKYGALSSAQKAKRPFYLDVLRDLSAIKLAWRNPTMHIVKSYEPAQAKSIYGAVETFMKHLASEIEPQPIFTISSGPALVSADES